MEKMYERYRQIIIYPQDFQSKCQWKSFIKQLDIEDKDEDTNYIVLHVAKAEIF